MKTPTSGFTWAHLVPLLALHVVSCSSSKEAAPASPEDACKDYLTSYCNAVNRCAPFYVSLDYKDTAGCIAAQTSFCLDWLKVPGTSTTTGYLQSCGKALDGVACDRLFSEPLPECETKPGTLTNGTGCADDSQCASTHCSYGTATDCGACADFVTEGGSCTSMSDCKRPLVCYLTSDTPPGTCVTPVSGEGTDCTAAPCASPLACVSGKCTKLKGPGEACQSPAECDVNQGVLCSGQNTCDPAKVAQAGEPCGLVDQDYIFCAFGSQCLPDGSGKEACMADAPNGAACDAQKGPLCTTPASCDNGVCKIQSLLSCK